jgi:HAD superfamily hydrolase (TIGR01509 family)
MEKVFGQAFKVSRVYSSQMTPPFPQAVLFDMDGTILEPVEDGLPEFKAHWGIEADQLVIPNLPRLPPEATEAFKLLEVRVAEQSVLRAGVRELLEELRAAGIKTALVTNNARSSATTVLTKHQVNFDLVLSRDDAAMKPAPDMLLLALERLQTSASHAIMVGDTRPDLGAARNAKIPLCILLAEHWNELLEVDEPGFRVVRVQGIAGVREQLERTRSLSLAI